METNAIGLHVKYFDMMGCETYGYIVAVEESHDPEVPYVYIVNEDSEIESHEDFVNGQNIIYTDIRPSTEVIIDN